MVAVLLGVDVVEFEGPVAFGDRDALAEAKALKSSAATRQQRRNAERAALRRRAPNRVLK